VQSVQQHRACFIDAGRAGMPKEAMVAAEARPDGVRSKYQAVAAKWLGVVTAFSPELQEYIAADAPATAAVDEADAGRRDAAVDDAPV
jgi:hypothetical protein